MKIRLALIAAIIAATSATGVLANGSIAVGVPGDVAQFGVAAGFVVDGPNNSVARRDALAICRNSSSSNVAKNACRTVKTFRNQCVAIASDPRANTTGFGWAVAASSQAAANGAIAKCKQTAGEARQRACKINLVECDGQAQ